MDFGSIWLWVGFNAFVVAMLALDLLVFHRKAHAVTMREALLTSGGWIALALALNLGLYFWRGGEVALEFLAGYLIEKSLGVIASILTVAVVASALGAKRAAARSA